MPTSTELDPRITDLSRRHLANLRAEVQSLIAEVGEEAGQLVEQWFPRIRRADFQPGARRLAIHLALRRRDLRALEQEFARYGLSLPTEGWARAPETLAAISALLARASGLSPDEAFPAPGELNAARLRLGAQACSVLGPVLPGRRARLIVTLPASVAGDEAFATKLLRLGVEAIRLDLGRDDEGVWRIQVETFRRVAAALDLPLRVLAELSGPRLATVRFDETGERRRYAEGDSFWFARAPSDLPRGEHGIGCSQPQLIGQLRFGDSVWLDQGELGARVVERVHGAVRLEVIQAPAEGKRLKAGRSLHFPDTELAISALGDEDRAALPFAAAHADILAGGRVQGSEDVAALLAALDELPSGGERLALAIRIATRSAVRKLPEILVAAAGRRPCAVMLSRTELAVETGPERLAEVQAEVLALCEAACVPVIWSAPELDRLTRREPPSRSDLADAAAAVRTDAVLLDRGPKLLQAVDRLAEVLARKPGELRRSARLDALASWQASFD